MPLKIVRNDITKMNTEAIVNTANESPVVSTGCDSAIYKAAGCDELLKYRKEKIGSVPEGEAFITPGFQLEAKYIIHAVSPLYLGGRKGEEERLRSCYRNSLKIAGEKGIKSISFPLISTGGFGYPKEEGMRIAVDEINAFLLKNDMDVYLVVFGKESSRLGEKVYPDLEAYIDQHYVEEAYEEEYGDSFLHAGRMNGFPSYVAPIENPVGRDDACAPAEAFTAEKTEAVKDRSREAEVIEHRPQHQADGVESIGSRTHPYVDDAEVIGYRPQNHADFQGICQSPFNLEEPSEGSAGSPRPSLASESLRSVQPSLANESSRLIRPSLASESSKSSRPSLRDRIFRKKAKERPKETFSSEPSIQMDEPMETACESSPVDSNFPYAGFEEHHESRSTASKLPHLDFEEQHESRLEERIRHMSDTYSEYLLYLIQQKQMENAEVWKRAIVDKRIFSKIKNNPNYHPNKLTALCLCVGAKLNLDESKDLLARAGYALSPCDKTDIIFSYFIENEIYDMIELDIQLEEHGLPCIIS